MGSYDKALQVVELVGDKKLSQAMLDYMLQGVASVLPRSTPHDVLNSMKEDIKNIYEGHEAGLKDIAVGAYVRTYSDEELDLLIDFYGSEAGQNILAKSQVVANEVIRDAYNYESLVIVPEITKHALGEVERLEKKKAEDEATESD